MPGKNCLLTTALNRTVRDARPSASRYLSSRHRSSSLRLAASNINVTSGKKLPRTGETALEPYKSLRECVMGLVWPRVCHPHLFYGGRC
jgi:hypothetical protein